MDTKFNKETLKQTLDKLLGAKHLMTGAAVLLAVALGVQSWFLIQLQQQVDDLSSTRAVAHRGVTDPSSDPWSDAWTDPLADPWLLGADDWNPFAEMQRMQERMNRMFGDAFGRFGASPRFGGLVDDDGLDLAFTPSVDLVEEDERFVARVDLPGAEESDIRVTLDGDRLRIEASRVVANEARDDGDGGVTVRRERHVGRFVRTLTLPGAVDAARMETKYEDGVLTVLLPKAAAA